MSELPKGWSLANLSEILSEDGIISDGDWVESKDQDTNGEVRLIQLADIGDGIFLNKSDRFMNDEQTTRLRCTFLREGDVLIARMPDPLGRACLFPCLANDAVTVVDVCLVRFTEQSALINKLFMYWVNSPQIRNLIDMQASGSTRRRITRKKLALFNFPIPPLNEQIRIADKLDSILAKVDQAQARLEKIPHILKRFRQSVLAAATSGELTREWRGKDESFETEIPDFFIPIEWKYSNIEEIGVVKGGKRLPKGEVLTEVDTGLPYIRAGQLKNGTVIQGDNARNKQMFLQPETQAQIKRYTVNEGDAYLTIVGASIGDAGIIPKALHLANLTENAAKITDLKSLINTSFLSLWLRSEKLQQLIQLEIKSGAQGKLALKRINTLPVPLPPLDEQKEIVRRVEVLFSYAANVEKNYQEMKSRVDRLTQSVLAKAFRGELVPQDSNDEPASELLKRIKFSEVESKPKKKASPKRIAATTTEPKITKQVATKLSEQFEETFNVDLDAEKHEATDSLRTRYQSEIRKAQDSLLDAKFSVEQFRSVTEFKGDYEALKALIMNLLKGISGISEPILEIESWDEKSGDYLMRLVDQK
ncbi:restriction endonuclease subunit S [Shewanella sp. Arc9-LZ]|uniref:restriction endonuclease subunit S n=1 Tax=Shewanella sp. Arc9-LZ TaxID=2698686 RepID=UPI00137BCFF8|nr:restriction endonuclease subunit S [Shewanella sp. Arc9-LZ]QHS12689.1 type I restriction endonuclease subunit S [Shewanella sp. Arc9-LZ]